MIVALLCAFAAGTASAVEVGEPGPSFQFNKSWNALDRAKQLDDYRGKAVLLEVWATW
jgi:hypothetical protein